MKSTLRHAVLSLAGRLPPPPRRLVRIFYGHSLRPRDVPAFRRNLRMLRDHFEFVSLNDAVADSAGRPTRPTAGSRRSPSTTATTTTSGTWRRP